MKEELKKSTNPDSECFLVKNAVVINQFSFRDDQPLPNFNSLAVNVRIPERIDLNDIGCAKYESSKKPKYLPKITTSGEQINDHYD